MKLLASGRNAARSESGIRRRYICRWQTNDLMSDSIHGSGFSRFDICIGYVICSQLKLSGNMQQASLVVDTASSTWSRAELRSEGGMTDEIHDGRD